MCYRRNINYSSFVPNRFVPLFIFLLVLVSFCGASSSNAGAVSNKYIQLVVSSNAGDRLAEKPSIAWQAPSCTFTTYNDCNSCLAQSGENLACLSSAESTLGQQIDGFGGSFMRSGATLLSELSSETQERLLTDLFDPVQGAGFTLGKVPIGATDFGVPYWYTYEDTFGNFSIEHDVTGVGAVIPFVKRAANKTNPQNPLWLQATMDYPPEYMMNTTTPLPHPILNSTWYPQLAEYYLNYSMAFANASGFPLRYLSMFNEPYSSYVTPTADQIVDLLVNHVGPLFRRTPGTPMLTWGEQYGRMISLTTGPYIMNSSHVQDYVDVLFYHGYDCGDNGGWTCSGPEKQNTTCPHLDWAMSNITAYKAMYPNLKMWMTEVCYATEFNDYPNTTYDTCPPIPRTDFEDGLQWGRMLFGDMLAGASGWVYWNLLLNTSGGPYLFSEEHNDPWNNVQHPVVIVDSAEDDYLLTGCYYFMAHFSRYVTRGMYRINLHRAASTPPNVYMVGFTNRSVVNGTAAANDYFVVHWMNDNVVDVNVTLWVDGWSATVALPAISITTMRFLSPNATGVSPAAALLPACVCTSSSTNGSGSNQGEDSGERHVIFAVVGGGIVAVALGVIAAVLIRFQRKRRAAARDGEYVVPMEPER